MPRNAPRRGFTNRTDLIGPPKLANTTAPGQGYGEAAAQQAAQRAIPMAPTPLAAGSSAPPAPLQPAPPPLPGGRGNFLRPTERPNEPVTHGLPTGPGAGPEALTGVGAAAREGVMGQATLQQLLSNLAAQPGAPSAVQDLAARVQGGAQ